MNSDIDMTFFKELNKKMIFISSEDNKYYKDYSGLPDDVIIKYGKDWDEFCGKQEFLKYQKKIIELKQIFRIRNLSPVEKLMIAYDLVKTKPYNLSADESLNGLPHEVLFGEYISCRGYCNLLVELLDNEGIKIVNQSLDVFDKNGKKVDSHARCTVLLDDDKYNIHGLFVVSPTEDSYKEENKMYLGNDLQPTDLYSWFLRPLRNSELYHDDNYEFRISDMYTDDEILGLDGIEKERICINNPEFRLNDLIENNELDELTILNDDVFNNLFDGLTKEKILYYINTDYINFNLMLEIITNVRREQGYSEEQIATEIERISRINSGFFSMEIQPKIL